MKLKKMKTRCLHAAKRGDAWRSGKLLDKIYKMTNSVFVRYDIGSRTLDLLNANYDPYEHETTIEGI